MFIILHYIWFHKLVHYESMMHKISNLRLLGPQQYSATGYIQQLSNVMRLDSSSSKFVTSLYLTDNNTYSYYQCILLLLEETCLHYLSYNECSLFLFIFGINISVSASIYEVMANINSNHQTYDTLRNLFIWFTESTSLSATSIRLSTNVNIWVSSSLSTL